MKIYKNPDKKTWTEMIARPQLELSYLDGTVRNILKRVRDSGDVALRDLTYQFDKVKLKELEVSPDEFSIAENSIDEKLKSAIRLAAANIKKFHAAQIVTSAPIETMPGVTCWRKAVPIEKIGIYIPGGSAPLFSTVLMLGVPASLAKCKEVILCTPPDPEGNVHPGILYAAQIVGINRIFKVGGAQAIAALAYGTESIPKVFKIFGPGNQYVTKAKQLVMEDGIAIDIPAGPSELLVLADDTADPAFVAADLLSQAEHGADSQVVLVSIGENAGVDVIRELEFQLKKLPRKSIAEKSIANSLIVNFNDLETAIQFMNEYAPEHLILNTANAAEIGEQVHNAGSVFLGGFSPEAVGDYASGTNHTLPTNGYARAFSGVSLESFMKTITFQKITENGLRNIGPAVQTMAEAENLIGHKIAVELRLNKLV